MKKLILLSGKKFVGKDTVAGTFVTKYKYKPYALADELKSKLVTFLLTILDTSSLLNFWGSDFWDTDKKEKVIWKKGDSQMTIRQMMQWFGQMMKSQFGEQYWVEQLIYKIDKYNKNIIITDCRFEYELTGITKKLEEYFDIYTIRIKRDTNIIDNDVSETHLDAKPDEDFDFIIDNNGTKNDLANRVDEIINYIK